MLGMVIAIYLSVCLFVAEEVMVSGCAASSEYSYEYRCENAINNMESNEWASNGEGTNMWFQV